MGLKIFQLKLKWCSIAKNIYEKKTKKILGQKWYSQKNSKEIAWLKLAPMYNFMSSGLKTCLQFASMHVKGRFENLLALSLKACV